MKYIFFVFSAWTEILNHLLKFTIKTFSRNFNSQWNSVFYLISFSLFVKDEKNIFLWHLQIFTRALRKIICFFSFCDSFLFLYVSVNWISFKSLKCIKYERIFRPADINFFFCVNKWKCNNTSCSIKTNLEFYTSVYWHTGCS